MEILREKSKLYYYYYDKGNNLLNEWVIRVRQNEFKNFLTVGQVVPQLRSPDAEPS